MNRILKLSGLLLMAPLLLLTYSCETDDAEASVGALVGTWELSALTGTYIRDIAQPEGNTTTSYSVTASWNYAAAVLDADSASADQVIASFSVGDTVLNRTSALPSASALTASGVAMTGVFKSDDVYTLTGTYPTLRLDESACNTYQTVAQITDQGFFSVIYNSDNTGGTLTIAPDASLGDQVLPPFDDATVTFTNDGKSLNIMFNDRDSHDSKFAEVLTTWDETGKRVTMGIAGVPYNPVTGAFTTTSDTLASSGYLMSDQLAPWGGENYGGYGYMTWNALQYNGCLAAAVAAGGDGTSCVTSHASYLADDSADVFDITCLADGDPTDCKGKLMYNVNAICIPVNEVILFDADFEKTAD